ncbi:MAG: hypothetical protein CL910_06350 [Deltaproteobacteria bacterium]|jgi:hypothetical protein|nr:hypothetical protein [Deltaproteobacteria bacterium]
MTSTTFLATLRRLAVPLAGAMGLIGCGGEHLGPGSPTAVARAAPEPESGPQVLFGDLHTHTHFSMDAWAVNLPVIGGEGTHPPADACDFARYCSGLDFWSINDHAEGLTPRHWAETRRAVRDCNAVTDPARPDLVTFLGWEWTQVGTEAETHFGHKNVVLRDTADDATPTRPISAPRDEFQASPIPRVARWLLPIVDFAHRDYYPDWEYRYEEVAAVPRCAKGVDVRELPPDCMEVAADPAELFEKLDQWAFPSLVIPHGTSWGLMTPAETEIGRQLTRELHDPVRQNLFEIYSGHGSAEEYRSCREVARDAAGKTACSPPTPAFTPCCWRAGEVVRERCEASGGDDCSELESTARRHFLDAGAAGHTTISGVTPADWRDCGQCRDCPLSAYSHRPTGSAQAALVAASLDGSGRRFRFGFIGSSDTHKARPGNGYKEFARGRMTDAMGKLSGFLGTSEEPVPESRAVVLDEVPLTDRRYVERNGSFYVTGGLVAAIAEGRTRDAIWDALTSRRVYGTSGPRIPLGFELLRGEGPAPMGSELEWNETPRFRVTATGARKQRPGCPAEVKAALSPERLELLCAGECHYPGDERWNIAGIEVVRIRPQRNPAEPREPLIEDPWRSLPCPAASPSCEVHFEDPDYLGQGREVAYYVRALQEETPAIAADPVRCERDERGRCLAAELCGEDAEDPDCLSPVQERAWSSPIFLRPSTP